MGTGPPQRPAHLTGRGFGTTSAKGAVLSHAGSRVLTTRPVRQLELHDDIGQIATLKFMPEPLCGMCPLSTLIASEFESKHCLSCEDSGIKIKQGIGIRESREITITSKQSFCVHSHFAGRGGFVNKMRLPQSYQLLDGEGFQLLFGDQALGRAGGYWTRWSVKLVFNTVTTPSGPGFPLSQLRRSAAM